MEKPRTRPVFRVLGTIAVVAVYVTLAPQVIELAQGWQNRYLPIAMWTLMAIGGIYRMWTME